MLKNILLLAILVQFASASCGVGSEIGKAKASDNENYNATCMDAIRKHIKVEFSASLQYLMMAAHFAQDTINLNGFAQLFFKSANEEREHGIQFLDYIKMRGDATVDLGINSLAPILGKSSWTDGSEALKDALEMEKEVSRAIKGLIEKCEDGGDFLSADYLTGTWLQEQLEGQRELAGMINTLTNFRKSHEDLADWMFSNNLLKEN